MAWTRFLRLPLAVFGLSGVLFSGMAHAIALAPIVVRSYLGQNLVAEIDILNLTAPEEASLKASIAAPKVFLDLNMDYSQSIGDAQVELLRRPDGKRFIKLRSVRPIAEPFVDLVIEVSSNAAKLVRPFRLLLDPPAPEEETIAMPDLARSGAVAMSTPVIAANGTEPSPLAALGPAKLPQDPLAARAQENQEIAPDQTQNITVRIGDTAGKIANRFKPSGASVEQMLTALLQSNPRAFLRGNVNLIQAGAAVLIPPAEAVLQVDATQARTTIAAQALAFGTLQQAAKKQIFPAQNPQFSTTAPSIASVPHVKSPDDGKGDALKLSKNTKGNKKEVEKLEKIAKDRNKQSELERAAELAKNIQELNALAQASTVSTPSTSASQASATAATAPTLPAVGALPGAPNADSAVSTPQQPASQAMDSAAAASAAAGDSDTERAAEAPPFWDLVFDTVRDAWAMLLLGGATLAAGIGALRWTRRRQALSADALTPASAMRSEAPWAANTEIRDASYGGDQVDTSQSDPKIQAENTLFAAELDPVAEADVYLAYGKDEPAEEILREGLVQDAKRVAIHLKLAEIYAARQDNANFTVCADQVRMLAGADGAEWAQIQALGQSLEPGNPRYQARPAARPLKGAQGGRLDFENSMFKDAAAPIVTGASIAPVTSTRPPLDPVLSFAPTGEGAMGAAAQATLPQPMAFELDAGSLDLAADPSPHTQGIAEQLETSMELAKKFIEIGELQGARSMLQEVMGQGTVAQRTQAQTLLAKLQ